jgi:hypothetical protein
MIKVQPGRRDKKRKKAGVRRPDQRIATEGLGTNKASKASSKRKALGEVAGAA